MFVPNVSHHVHVMWLLSACHIRRLRLLLRASCFSGSCWDDWRCCFRRCITSDRSNSNISSLPQNQYSGPLEIRSNRNISRRSMTSQSSTTMLCHLCLFSCHGHVSRWAETLSLKEQFTQKWCSLSSSKSPEAPEILNRIKNVNYTLDVRSSSSVQFRRRSR